MGVAVRPKGLFAVHVVKLRDNQSRNHSRDDQLELPLFRNFSYRIRCQPLHKRIRCRVEAHQAADLGFHVDAVYDFAHKRAEHAMREAQARRLQSTRPSPTRRSASSPSTVTMESCGTSSLSSRRRRARRACGLWGGPPARRARPAPARGTSAWRGAACRPRAWRRRGRATSW